MVLAKVAAIVGARRVKEVGARESDVRWRAAGGMDTACSGTESGEVAKDAIRRGRKEGREERRAVDTAGCNQHREWQCDRGARQGFPTAGLQVSPRLSR